MDRSLRPQLLQHRVRVQSADVEAVRIGVRERSGPVRAPRPCAVRPATSWPVVVGRPLKEVAGAAATGDERPPPRRQRATYVCLMQLRLRAELEACVGDRLACARPTDIRKNSLPHTHTHTHTLLLLLLLMMTMHFHPVSSLFPNVLGKHLAVSWCTKFARGESSLSGRGMEV